MGAERVSPPRGMRVLMTADTVGGVWQYALQLAGSLNAIHGMQVELATMGAPVSPAQRRQAALIAGLTLHESSFRLEWMTQPWDDLVRAGAWLQALEARLVPDVVHLNQFAFGALSFRAPTLLVAHSCVVSWWQAVHGTGPPAQWDRYRELVRAGVAGAGLVAAPTRDMLASLARNHGLQRPGLVLTNGRDPQTFRPGSKRPLIISAGRLWDEAKNVRVLNRVADEVAWPIEVAGPKRGPDGAEWHSGDLCLLGQLSEVALARRLSEASICVHPARYEPFGLAPLEAALAGCALVLGDVPSLREIWGCAAEYVAPDDSAGWAAALNRLIADPDLLRRMGQRAREVALRHSDAAMARAYVAAYTQAATAATAAATLATRPAPHVHPKDKQCAS